MICGACGIGNLHDISDTVYVEGDRNYPYTLKYSVCDSCFSELAGGDQCKENVLASQAARALRKLQTGV